MAGVSIHERYLAKVVRRESGCWGWSGAKCRGYGILSTRRGSPPAKAHRVSYELFKGPIPDGMLVRHTCDNPECTNPDHLLLGTDADNARDRVARGRSNPKSYLNLRPGARGYHGAGPLSNAELKNGVTQ